MNLDEHALELVDGYCNGSLTDDEFSELGALLRSDSSLRRTLLEYRMLDSDLRGYASAAENLPPLSDDNITTARTIRRLRAEVWATVAVIAVLLIGIAWLGFRQWELKPIEQIAAVDPVGQHDPGVAVLARAIDADWEEHSLRVGDAISPRRLNLRAGTVELEFYSGALVVLEGPSLLSVVSENGGILHAGKLRAHVPHHAHGFTISTESVELVDLGTSFGVEVGQDSGTEVHVFDGKVELFKPKRPRHPNQGQSLVAGEARRVELTGESTAIVADDSRFTDSIQLSERLRTRYTNWVNATQTLEDDPRLLVRYDFERDVNAPRSLLNYSADRDDGLRGAVIGARWSTGRWPNKTALDFKRPSDRVRIEVPDTSRSITLVAWLRIDGFDNQFHSLLLSDGWDRVGAVHWQIHKAGFVELAVWNNKDDHANNSRAPFVMQPSDFGRWMQLAAVYDGEQAIVSHYRDGNLLGTLELQKVVPLAIGKAEIGNWSPPPADIRLIRNFNGVMDELMIFDDALPADQIAELYENGMP